MQLDELLSRLERIKKSGGQYMARCPAHQDRSPSLSITENDKGIALNCHAGCDTRDILAALGLEWKDLMHDTNDEPEAVYTYTDESGSPLYEVVRFPGKQFRQRKPNGDWNLNGTRRVLYRLPEVLYGIEQGKTVYLCEGEKDCEAIRKHGKVATCTPGGASNWRDEYAASLKDATVVIVQDKDEPGRAYANAASQSLRGLARAVYIVQAKQGKDAHDHLVTHGLPVEEFVRADDTNDDGIVVPIKTFKDFAAGVKPYMDEREYLGPLLYGGNRIHIAGPTGHGKTSWMLEAEGAALRGDNFLGFRGRGNLRALHIDLEMPDHLLHRAIVDARAEDVNLLHLPDGLHIDTNESHRQMIEKAVQGYDIVCIDPWYKLVEHEMEYSSARAVIGLLDGLRKKHPRMAMLVGFHSHEPHSADQRLNIASIRGFGVWHNPADVILTFHRTGGNLSRIVWAKDRPGRLGVSIGEEWTVEWRRGRGFERVYECGDDYVPGVVGS